MSEFKLDFIGIGSGRAGTTWLYSVLSEHPDVCMGRGKEQNYFCKVHPHHGLPTHGSHYTTSHYHLGINWLKSRFSQCRKGQIKGEISPAYMFDPESPELIYKHNPKVKLLVNLRNPVEVVYSGYHQLSLMQPIHEDFEKAIKKYSYLLPSCKFYTIIQRYLQFFPIEQMHFVFMDDIKSDSDRVYRELCDFLGINASFKPVILHEKVNTSKTVRSKLLRDIFAFSTDILNANRPMKVLKGFLNLFGIGKMAHRLHYEWNRKFVRYKPMNDRVRRWLVKYYAAENVRLGKLLNRDLSHWNR